MASGGGGRCIQPREIGDQPWIAPRCVAHPDPDYAVALDDGPAAHPGGAKNGALWICHTCTGVIEAEPMITADENAAIIDLAGAERREAIRPATIDRPDLAGRITKQGHRFVKDGASAVGSGPEMERGCSNVTV